MGPMLKSFRMGSSESRPCSMAALSTEAVASGRMLTEEPDLSVKVYICFSTTSVSSPMPRRKSSVRSRTGVLSSTYPKSRKIFRAVSSTNLHLGISRGRISFIPRIAFISTGMPPKYNLGISLCPSLSIRLRRTQSPVRRARLSRAAGATASHRRACRIHGCTYHPSF